MKKYLIMCGCNSSYGNEFFSTSRNATNHLRENFGDDNSAWCNVYTADGKTQLSAVVFSCNDNKIIRVEF